MEKEWDPAYGIEPPDLYGRWASLVAQMVKNLACNARDLGSIPGFGRSPGGEHGKPTPRFWSGESPWTEEPGGLQSMGLQRVRHDWATKHSSPAAFARLRGGSDSVVILDASQYEGPSSLSPRVPGGQGCMLFLFGSFPLRVLPSCSGLHQNPWMDEWANKWVNEGTEVTGTCFLGYKARTWELLFNQLGGFSYEALKLFSFGPLKCFLKWSYSRSLPSWRCDQAIAVHPGFILSPSMDAVSVPVVETSWTDMNSA